MSLTIPIGFAECAIAMTSSSVSHVASVTFGLSASTPTDFNPELADQIAGLFATSFVDRIDSTVIVGPATLAVGQDGAPLTISGTFTQEGTHSMTPLPPNCAALAKKASATGGRRGRGRMFVPWVLDSADVNDSGRIATTPLAALNVDAAAFLTGLDSDLATPMVILHSSGISTAGDPSPVTGLAFDSLIATQRRRLGR